MVRNIRFLSCRSRWIMNLSYGCLDNTTRKSTDLLRVVPRVGSRESRGLVQLSGSPTRGLPQRPEALARPVAPRRPSFVALPLLFIFPTSPLLPTFPARLLARVLFNALLVCLRYEEFSVNFLSGFSVSSCQVIPCFYYFNQTHTKDVVS